MIDNTIRGTTAEAIDVKEGTSGGVLARNTFDGSAMTEKGGDSWVDVKGNGWLVADNQGTSALRDGYQTHEVVDGWGNKNIFAGNKASKINKAPQDGPGVGVGVRPALGNVVTCTNMTEGWSGQQRAMREGFLRSSIRDKRLANNCLTRPKPVNNRFATIAIHP